MFRKYFTLKINCLNYFPHWNVKYLQLNLNGLSNVWPLKVISFMVLEIVFRVVILSNFLRVFIKQ